MQFLKTLFWIALTVCVILFSRANWSNVTIDLWGGLQADVKLPVLLVAAFLGGLLPMLAVHSARMWGMKRRIEGFERQVSLMVQPAPAPPAAPAAPSPELPAGMP